MDENDERKRSELFEVQPLIDGRVLLLSALILILIEVLLAVLQVISDPFLERSRVVHVQLVVTLHCCWVITRVV